jgi:hypothetical protein
MGNKAILHVFFVIFTDDTKADLRLKRKKWELCVLCILIITHKIAYKKNHIDVIKQFYSQKYQ